MIQSNRFVGLVGLGYWGKNLLRNFYDLGVLHSACDISKKNISEKSKTYPGIKYYTSFKELLSNPDIQAVAIATPAVTHYELAEKSLLAGKDVFVEKPLSLTSNDGEKLLRIAEKNKKIIMVGHLLQYHPAVIKLKEMISKNILGDIRYIYSNRLNIGKLRTEENILWSFAPHDISVLLMLINDEPISVSAFSGDYINPGISDVTLTTLEFRNKIKAHVFVSWLHPYKEQKLIVVGSKAMAVFDDVNKEKLLFYPHKIKWEKGDISIAVKAEHRVIPVSADEPLKLELQHFVDCVTSRKTPKTDGVEGIRVLKILEMAETSLNRRRDETSKKKR